MPIQMLKPLLLPLLILVAVNLVAFAWRAIPQDKGSARQDSDWQTLQPLPGRPDVRDSLLAGGHWGRPADNPAQRGEGEKGDRADGSPEATAEVLGKHIQRQLQGIIRRGDWVLLFAQPATDSDSLPLPLELRSGDDLPDTPWQIGQIWADRIQLVQQGHEALIVPLYPVAESVTEL